MGCIGCMDRVVTRSEGVSKVRAVGYDMGGMDRFDDDQAYSRMTCWDGMGWDGMGWNVRGVAL